MELTPSLFLNLGAALGVGLLIGIERERHKGTGPTRGAAGMRTFALVSLAGALALQYGGEALLAVAALFVAALAVVSYWRTRGDDPGITTEVALFVTFILGAVAMRDAQVAAALGASVAILLAARSRLHRFVSRILTEDEFHDALLLAGAALVVLPLVPDQALGPFHAVNPRTLWRLTVLIMSISAAGHIAVRAMGPRFGLPLAGFASGFISSSATIGTMGQKARAHPALRKAATAGAVWSSVASLLQMFVVIGATDDRLFARVAVPLGLASAAAAVYSLLFMLRMGKSEQPQEMNPGRPFDPRAAVFFASLVAVVSLVSSALTHWLGSVGAVAASGAAGFADAHSAAISAAALSAAGTIPLEDAVVPILVGLSTNGITKIVLGYLGGGRHFLMQLLPGIVLTVAAAWLGFFVA
jgi:uncharacterized membrane protein (DUF4010 family)